MQPTDIHAIVKSAVAEGVWFSWWSFFIAFLVSLVGAYLGAYITRKGEDRATRESFDRLREQLRRTTLDAEEIKQTLSGRTWLTQQQWSAREKYYTNLLTHLHKLRISLDDLQEYYFQPGSEHTPDSQQGKRFHVLLQRSNEAYNDVRRLIGPSSIFLSPGASAALEKLVDDHWSITHFSECTSTYVSAAHELSADVYERILSEARQQLQVTRTDA
ncbi:MAG: hypothetical protein OJI67_18785 [Prosthecobacter sp.]|nr:hypothetical protein [Prosthecobacter sp.]